VRAKMHLIHYADDFDPAGGTIPLLRQGRVYEV
jgi:hypothetical protein